MNPTFYYGIVKRGETPEEVYEKNRPKVLVAGAGVVTQPNVKTANIDAMSRMAAIGYLHTNSYTFSPALLVPIEENRDEVAWMWGVWLAAPDDFFVETHEEAYWTPRMIDNYVIDVMRAREPDRSQPIEFIRM